MAKQAKPQSSNSRLWTAIAALGLVAILYLSFGYFWSDSQSNLVSATPRQCYTIEGFSTCGYFQAASRLGEKLRTTDSSRRSETGKGITHSSKGEVQIVVNSKGVPRQEWQERLRQAKANVPGNTHTGHRTSPFVYEGCEPKDYRYIGGSDDFHAHVQKIYGPLE